MKSALKQVIQNAILISGRELENVLTLFKPLKLKKDDYFLRVGKPSNQVAFIESGVLRIFYPNDKGEETTCHFALPGEFITSFSSFTAGIPSSENIQALSPTELLTIEKKDLEWLYKQYPLFQDFGRKSAEGVALMMEKRLSLFLNNTAEERYQYLLENRPVLFQSVPLQYLASYIGISPQHLSRLRKKIR